MLDGFEVGRRICRPVFQNTGRYQGKRSKPLLIRALSPGKDCLPMADRQNGCEVFPDVCLAGTGWRFDKGKAVLIDRACCLIDKIGLEGLRGTSCAGFAGDTLGSGFIDLRRAA